MLRSDPCPGLAGMEGGWPSYKVQLASWAEGRGCTGGRGAAC